MKERAGGRARTAIGGLLSRSAWEGYPTGPQRGRGEKDDEVRRALVLALKVMRSAYLELFPDAKAG